MSNLDLTAANEAAIYSNGQMTVHASWQEMALDAVTAAAPLIEAQVRDQVAREIEALIEASPASGMFTGTGEYVTQRWVPANELRSFIARGPKP